MKARGGRIPRLFAGVELRPGMMLTLPEGPAHHATRVLRLAAGDPLTLFDGRGGEYEARIASASRGRVAVEVLGWRRIECESPLAATLVQGVSTGDKMDFIIQKAVELGVAAIQPVLTARSVVRFSAGRGMAKLAHWQRIVSAACEQCGRNRLPEIRGAVPLQDYCAGTPGTPSRVLLSPRGNARLADVAATAGRAIVLAAGPEAGFGPEDESLLIKAGFVPVRLGPRVLRAETTALAALAALNALAGDF
ncbi:MAG TPA: 16S rRNA (uracil(1498)-N(3))-methyltransferase [Burkholderiales bacterium]|nr:16S rRNA (uracil(1498)-N(3))-methyltransferase [Burkholderiales bacterium]